VPVAVVAALAGAENLRPAPAATPVSASAPIPRSRLRREINGRVVGWAGAAGRF
jgi:hypothetical protein